jgi:hypothetical protein
MVIVLWFSQNCRRRREESLIGFDLSLVTSAPTGF